ncbi:hypothetical protein LOTGIDRAFT_172759 [Lottia gigantea]|uniref:beta-N-acetylhexosaminidase n=1 Tax=Lottia gigantea TaxID=225164 RepID=V4CGC7_LOTGI|nr:hypothetical protein LOTGIDRAFT_172759 [Lottia gigantea]ESP01130.1 hypothetical protein LOTGIDRAFT_172759 [Lottia gigantea]
MSRPEQWKRSKTDVHNPYSAQDRYRRYHDSMDDETKTPDFSIPLIPKPIDVITTSGHGSIKVNNSWVIRHSEALTSEGKYLKGETGLSIANKQTSKNVIELIIDDVIHPLTKKSFGHIEAYKLEVSSRASWIAITGKSASGVFNGIQSFLALFSTGDVIRDMIIVDQPRLSYRGMHVDVSRNFHPVFSIVKLIDGMAMVKMNKLHLHLSDDEGWRLEIPGLPELTEIGAKRCFNVDECLPPQLGSGPDSSTSGSGYYTISDYKKILQHASSRHIQVIPEFDFPGHARAAIKAMEKRYHDKINLNRTLAEEYLLHDFHDKSEYLSVQFYNDGAANPCLNSTYTFLGHVIDELINVHKDIQPLTLYHFGGDEVAKGAWVDSPKCQNLNHGNPMSKDQISDMFLKRVDDITSKRGLDMAAWEDGVSEQQKPFDKASLKSKDVYVYTWQNVWEWGTTDIAYRIANAGYKVILCQATYLYFDHPQEPDPEEPGMSWAIRFTDTKRVFSFIVDDIYQNTDQTVMGIPQTTSQVCRNNKICPPLKKPENIVGIQGQLWSETVRSPERLEYMIFPRLLALAERGWHKAAWESITDVDKRNANMDEDWSRFSKIVGRNYLWRLEKLGIRYRIPLPGGKVENNRILTNTEFPGHTIEYFLPEKGIWETVSKNTVYTENTPILLRTRNHDGSRISRTVVLHPGFVANIMKNN